ncbi:Holliday junction branch migration protein RuvA [Bartonella quintana]|uniref:Holliday junction branch migration complex subunit RuvA n=3 Tax=Bartonella quintana TaxID=803 RepID=RUVA_BARQU|nr:Holliday junction branch migration protein RuvA [Bartonella quintana]Q6FYP5.1 RecName: Full=Holliday junction branch migration complex subunit RuvA [Bartonella quintana str. Toulouse]AFR26786.1 Holliday junction DNA helicase RuvA [Bartonella quintana RM-11]ETS12869.1 Holliday junction ATP-dependent DNA helicase ruvA [Bartonella quintana BQ2-D70]ETS14709.1 Holliday junction ATP-dependent DNA helicase ruvA [Bartonella quintana JK 73rel]ETS17142.1 Holliday junction ATP-dependent DNA helicase r
MIGKLKGILEHVFDDHIIVDVQGVGYVVFISNRLRPSLPALGESLSLFIETHVREEAIRLFGFVAKAEQEWFCLLQNVPGVGAKVALAILGTLSPDELAQAIALNDIAMISRAPGVGKKVSERIVSELKSKALPFNDNALHFTPQPHLEVTHQPTNDALSALVKLGFERDQAARALALAMNALEGETVSSALLIRHSLKLLSPST